MSEKFRKKPVVIEAVQFTGGNHFECKSFIGEQNYDNTLKYPNITTLEGTMRVSEGDWIIKGVKGEFYPCKPDIFEATYEALGEEAECPSVSPYRVEPDGSTVNVFKGDILMHQFTDTSLDGPDYIYDCQTPTPEEPEGCAWGKDEDGIYQTDCGECFVFNDDGPKENGFKFCPYCGKTLKSSPTQTG